MKLAEVVRHAHIENAAMVNLWANSPEGLRYVGTWTVGARTLTCMGKTFAQVKAYRSVRLEAKHNNLDWNDLAFTVRARHSDWVLKSKARTLDLMTAGR